MPRIIVAQDNNISLPLVPDIPRTTKGGGGQLWLLCGVQEDWQQSTLIHFSALRTSLARLREKQESNCVGSSACYREKLHRRATPVPPLKASDSWHLFCFGSGAQAPCGDRQPVCTSLSSLMRFGEGGLGGDIKRGADSLDGSDAREGEIGGDSATSSDLGYSAGYRVTSHNRPTPPSVSLILQFDQILTQRVLKHHVRWLEELRKQQTALSGWREHMKTTWRLPERCRWAYALLVNLASPLHRDPLADIRRLYVASASLYNTALELKIGDTTVRALAVVCVVAGRHFEQSGWCDMASASH